MQRTLTRSNGNSKKRTFTMPTERLSNSLKIKKPNLKNCKNLNFGELLEVNTDYETINLKFETKEKSNRFMLSYATTIFEKLAFELNSEYIKPKNPSGMHILRSSEGGWSLATKYNAFTDEHYLTLQFHGQFFIFKEQFKRRRNIMDCIRKTAFGVAGYKFIERISRIDIAQFLLTDIDCEELFDLILSKDDLIQFDCSLRKFYNYKKEPDKMSGFSLNNTSFCLTVYDKKQEILDRDRESSYKELINTIASQTERKNIFRVELRIKDRQCEQYQSVITTEQENIDQKIVLILKNTLNRFFAYHKIKTSSNELNEAWYDILKSDDVKTINRTGELLVEQVQAIRFRDLPKQRASESLQRFVSRLSITKEEMLDLVNCIQYKDEDQIYIETQEKIMAHRRFLQSVYKDILSDKEIEAEVEKAKRALLAKYKPRNH